MKKTNFEIVNEAKEYFFSAYPNSYGILLFAYLYRINALTVVQNADCNIHKVMFTIDRDLMEITSPKRYKEWLENDVYSISIVANFSNSKLQEIYDFFVSSMQALNVVFVFDALKQLRSIEKKWFDENFSEIFECYFTTAQARKIARNSISSIHRQPNEVTKLISRISDFKGGSVYNPFAGIASYGIEFISKASSYYGQEIDKEAWAVGYLRLLANNVNTEGYVCENSIDNWAACNIDNQALPKFDLIVSTAPWNATLSRNTAEEYFLMQSTEGLSKVGRSVGIYSSKILFTSGLSKDIRKSLVKDDILETVVTLPEKIFPSTSIPPVLIIVSKNKKSAGTVKIVDGSSFFESHEQSNVLDAESLLSTIESNDPNFVKFISNSEIEYYDYNLSPAIYFNDTTEGLNIPAGFTLKELGDFTTIYHREKQTSILEMIGHFSNQVRIIREKDLSEHRFDVHRDFAQLELEEKKQDAMPLHTDLLLMHSVGRLKPTLFDYTEELNVYVNKKVMAFVVDTTKILPDYLADELGKEYVTKQVKAYSNGIAMQSISRVNMLKIKIMVPEAENVDFDEILKKRKSEYSAQRIAEFEEEIERIKSDNQQYREVAYHLLQSLYVSSGADHTIATLGFLIALSKKGRLFDYMEISKFDYIFYETIQLDDTTAVSISDVSRLAPTSHDVFEIIRILDTITDLDHAKLFEEIIRQYYAQAGKRMDKFSQPQELTHLVNSILNENHAHSVYNPFAGIGSYQLDNKEVDYYSQEINRNTWLIGKLRMYINGISCEYSCEDSLLRWEGENRKFDAVVATPPFKMQLIDEQQSFLYWEDLGFRHRTAESLYFSRSITSVKEGGIIIGVVPAGFLFDSTPAALGFRQYLLDNRLIQEVIQLPSNIFNTTSINTAIIVLSKRENASIRFIDAAECFTQSGRLNILDEERVANLRKNGDSENVRNISVNEVVEQNCDLTPSRYLEEEEVLPDGFNLIQLKDVVATVRGERADVDAEGICINIGDLSADGLNCILDINSLETGRTKNNFRRITSPVLLLSKVRVLKPTYIEASESMPIYISPNVMALEVDITKIAIPYLAYELSLKSDKLHRGAIIPNFRPNDILNLTIKVPALSSQQDVLLQEKAIIESLIQEDKKAKIKEFGLEEILENERQKYAAEIKVRKHDMMPYIREMGSIIQLTRYYAQENNELSIANILCLISKQESAIHNLNSLIEALSVEEVYGIAEKLNIDTYFYNLEINHLDQFSYDIQADLDRISLREAGFIPDPDPIKKVDVKKLLSDLDKPYQPEEIYVNIAKSDMDNLVNNIISNAVCHGFVDKSLEDYIIIIRISYDSIKNMFRIDFMNNGKPLPEGLTTERYALRGEKAGATGKTGIGGYRVNSIVKHYGGEVELYSDPYSTFPVTISIYLPIFRDDE